jgi:hypothetical protein
MFRPRSRKLRQTPRALQAVFTFNHGLAEPKHSASFTYLQLNAQVTHVIPFQGVPLPDEPRYFSTVERAHPGCCELHRLLAAALSAPSVRLRCSFYRCVPSVSNHGKNQSPCITLPHGTRRPHPALSSQGWPRVSVPNWESLKVIALDKNHVNHNLSSGN